MGKYCWGGGGGGGGGGFNEFQVIIGMHMLSSCTTGSILGNPGITHSVTLHSSVMKGMKWNATRMHRKGHRKE